MLLCTPTLVSPPAFFASGFLHKYLQLFGLHGILQSQRPSGFHDAILLLGCQKGAGLVLFLRHRLHLPLCHQPKKIQEWYTQLSASCCKFGKRVHALTPQQELQRKAIDATELMAVVDKYVDNAIGFIDSNTTQYSHNQAYQAMQACMLALTFGYNATPRPGQLLSLIHPFSPTKCDCESPSCTGNTIYVQPSGGLTLYITHHKNYNRTGQPLPPVDIPVGDTLHKLLSFWIFKGFRAWRNGTISDNNTDIGQWYLWCDQDGSKFNTTSWNRMFGGILEDELGVRMPPNRAR
jgi:hypothetical protein